MTATLSNVRIAVVSAHFPPNFVSGGTLQPERLARGLRARGHEVSVFAGHLWSDRPPLEWWDDHDETGLPVRWVVITPFIDWASDRNWDNPDVAAAFDEWLREVRPDVVHLHSLQTFGGELVAVAKRHGASVIVTMHDFWWVCARQFLVDRTQTPCSLVVDAGVCPCEIDRAWADARLQRLRTWLAGADAVLAPSAPAARVLAANGIAATVDENSMDAMPAVGVGSATSRRDGAVVHFVYAGGEHELKGIHVLLEAARLLATDHGVHGWRMTAYGAGPYIEQHGVDLDGLPVTIAEPYRPDELPDVFAAADVLVLTSLMETYSLLARESLSAGVPVITSDTLGPEEVVHDGVNGLVVPAGDSTALAEAMRRLLDDPDHLGRLRSGVSAEPLRLRSVAEQLDGLEALYANLDTRVRVPSSIRRVVFVVGIEGAPLRYRARLPAEALALEGVATSVHHYRDVALPDAIDAADVIVVYRVPATVQVLGLIARARSAGKPVVFDVDDLIFDPDILGEVSALRELPHDEYTLYVDGVRRYRTTLEACDGYIGSTPMLVRHVESVLGLPAALFENGVGQVLARRADAEVRRPRAHGPLRIGYFSGTTTHDEDWRHIEPAVIQALDRHPDVELWLGGHLADTPTLARFGSRVRRIPFMSWLDLPAVLRDVDVNLAPLEPGSRFNEAKSAIKWLEAALCETVTIASPTEPFRDAIEADVNGMLADTRDEWASAIERLLSDDLLRTRLGRRARRDALLRWSPHLQGQRYVAILHEARRWHDQRSDRQPSAWQDIAHDEPLLPVALEPYGETVVAATSPASRPAGPTRMERLRHSLRHDGVMATARRIVAVVRRRLRR